MAASTPLYLTIGIALFTALLGFLLNFLLNRMTKRQDRRIDWYDAVDRDRAAMHRHLEMMQHEITQMQKIVADLTKLVGRVEIAEMKIGMWWRHVEDQVADRLQPPPRHPPPYER